MQCYPLVCLVLVVSNDFFLSLTHWSVLCDVSSLRPNCTIVLQLYNQQEPMRGAVLVCSHACSNCSVSPMSADGSHITTACDHLSDTQLGGRVVQNKHSQASWCVFVSVCLEQEVRVRVCHLLSELPTLFCLQFSLV